MNEKMTYECSPEESNCMVVISDAYAKMVLKKIYFYSEFFDVGAMLKIVANSYGDVLSINTRIDTYKTRCGRTIG